MSPLTFQSSCKLHQSDRTPAGCPAEPESYVATDCDWSTQANLPQSTQKFCGEETREEDEKTSTTYNDNKDKEKIQKLQNEVERLKTEMAEMYSTREKRIKAAREIAKLENSEIYQHANLLCSNQDRYSVQNLADIDLAGLLSERNPVLVSFLEEICMPNTGIQSNTQYLAHAVELIYGARHHRFISPFMSAVQVVLFSLTRSRLAVDLMGHVTAGPCYDVINNILFKGTFDFPQAPEGLVEFSFDNEQRTTKNYINRDGNKVTLDIFTNIIASQLDPDSSLQYESGLKPSEWPEISETDVTNREDSMISLIQLLKINSLIC
ncbi:uncharacterized protein [Ptychodera flava]|uniref:uncharacterized protein n=1 Tax=Ptychodera flava TaxID=63121 RepID=UPI00396A291E